MSKHPLEIIFQLTPTTARQARYKAVVDEIFINKEHELINGLLDNYITLKQKYNSNKNGIRKWTIKLRPKK